MIRLSAQYFLRTLEIAKRQHGSDPLKAIIFTAIWSTNVSHLRPQNGYDSVPDLAPDALRRPVTVSRIAQLVGMPAETVRRYVLKLIEEGVCQRVGRRGVYVPAAIFLRDDMLACLDEQHQLASRYYKALTPLMDQP